MSKKNGYSIKKMLFAFMAVSLITACENSKKKSSLTTITGKLKNSDATIVRIGNDWFYKDIKLNPNGSFKKELNIRAGKYFVVDDKRQIFFYMYLPENGEVRFTVDANEFKENKKTIAFSGEAKTFNKYLVTERKSIESVLGRKDFMKEKPEFINTLDSIINSAKQTLENYTNLPKNLKDLELRDIEYDRYYGLFSYRPFRHYTDKSQIKETFPEEMEIDYIISSIDLSNEDDFNFSVSYRKLINNYCDIFFNRKGRGSEEEYIYFLSEKITNPYILNQMVYNQVKSRFLDSENPKAYYEAYMKFSTNAKQQKEITRKYEELKKVMPGHLSPKFTNYENYAGGTSSLSDFTGKYIYIDVWATWCGPCINQIPFLEKLQQNYKGKNIEFVSISIDSKKNQDKWKKMITEKDLKGIQLIADNEIDSQFIRDYLINGIPRFILLDPNGNIVNSNAPRPSNPETKKLLDSLLNK